MTTPQYTKISVRNFLDSGDNVVFYKDLLVFSIMIMFCSVGNIRYGSGAEVSIPFDMFLLFLWTQHFIISYYTIFLKC